MKVYAGSGFITWVELPHSEQEAVMWKLIHKLIEVRESFLMMSTVMKLSPNWCDIDEFIGRQEARDRDLDPRCVRSTPLH